MPEGKLLVGERWVRMHPIPESFLVSSLPVMPVPDHAWFERLRDNAVQYMSRVTMEDLVFLPSFEGLKFLPIPGAGIGNGEWPECTVIADDLREVTYVTLGGHRRTLPIDLFLLRYRRAPDNPDGQVVYAGMAEPEPAPDIWERLLGDD